MPGTLYISIFTKNILKYKEIHLCWGYSCPPGRFPISFLSSGPVPGGLRLAILQSKPPFSCSSSPPIWSPEHGRRQLFVDISFDIYEIVQQSHCPFRLTRFSMFCDTKKPGTYTTSFVYHRSSLLQISWACRWPPHESYVPGDWLPCWL